jgi:hypothetical protein
VPRRVEVERSAARCNIAGAVHLADDLGDGVPQRLLIFGYQLSEAALLMMTAWRFLMRVWSVKGNGTRTISPKL